MSPREDGAEATGSDFWSRRRRAVAAEELQEAKRADEEEAAVQREALEEKTDEEILSSFGLPDPDAMQEGDDFSAFLKSEVPDRLRRRALRRLWRSNPVLANLDSLVDYGEDYTDAATVIENLQTTYRVGKGMLAHIEKQLEAQQAKESSEEVEPDLVDEDEEVALEAEAPADVDDEVVPSQVGDARDEVATVVQPSDALPQAEAFVSPKRMRFVYTSRPEDYS